MKKSSSIHKYDKVLLVDLFGYKWSWGRGGRGVVGVFCACIKMEEGDLFLLAWPNVPILVELNVHSLFVYYNFSVKKELYNPSLKYVPLLTSMKRSCALYPCFIMNYVDPKQMLVQWVAPRHLLQFQVVFSIHLVYSFSENMRKIASISHSVLLDWLIDYFIVISI